MTDHQVLTAEAHAGLRIRRDRGADRGDAVMSCVTVPDEFRQVQAHYPILFRRNIERDEIVAVALFGFEEGENLFLDGAHWDADYVPLAIDIQPFLIGGAPGASGAKQVHVDMASARIAGAGAADEGVRVFDEHGRPTPYLETVAEQLGALDAGWQGAADFFAALRRHDLLEPLTFEITLDTGSTHRLVGFHAVNEDRLRALDGDALGELHRDGHLMPLFMAVASIGKIAALVGRKNRRMADG
ncbi:hypothetical protein J2Y54_001165 [Sphingomonas sp. BE123]|uniref:SapC family protein n=1 Tax=Sphingomonas sp. BE123 TaxID=2817842 RepID=UPI002856D0F5|nr:SapC family protein [Sphingomonas sp. BE123]MDR6851672.1 hypothetical protein [Sphingomonas sp. BE123]